MRMRPSLFRPHRFPAITFALGAALLGACGGTDSGDSGGSTRIYAFNLEDENLKTVAETIPVDWTPNHSLNLSWSVEAATPGFRIHLFVSEDSLPSPDDILFHDDSCGECDRRTENEATADWSGNTLVSPSRTATLPFTGALPHPAYILLKACDLQDRACTHAAARVVFRN